MGGFRSTRPRRATWAGVCLAERLPFVKFTYQLLGEISALSLCPFQMDSVKTCYRCAGIHE